MPKLSLSKRILKYTRNHYPEWLNGGEFERLALENGFKASNASRRCREMESGLLSDGRTCPIVLENKIEGGSVWYKSLPPISSTQYTNEDGKVIIVNKW